MYLFVRKILLKLIKPDFRHIRWQAKIEALSSVLVDPNPVYIKKTLNSLKYIYTHGFPIYYSSHSEERKVAERRI